MADVGLLDRAKQAERLAAFYGAVQAELRALDALIDAEVGKFSLAHLGETPDLLRLNYQGWQAAILTNMPQVEELIRRCHRQAAQFRADYARQQAEDAEQKGEQ